MTFADIAFIAKTGSLEVASAGWQVFAWVIVGLFALAYVALIAVTFLTDVPGSYRQRYERPAPEEAEAPAEEACLWCTPRNGFTDSSKCKCEDPCRISYCMRRTVRADSVLEAVEIVTEENRRG